MLINVLLTAVTAAGMGSVPALVVIVTDAGAGIGVPIAVVKDTGVASYSGNCCKSHGNIDHDNHHCSQEADNIEDNGGDVAPQGIGPTTLGLTVLSSIVMLLTLQCRVQTCYILNSAHQF